MGAAIVIRGLAAVITAMERRERKVSNSAVNIANKAALMVQGQAKMIVAVDTGALSQSITVDPAKQIGKKVEARVYTDKEYAPYVEFGTGVRGAATSTHQPKSGAVSYGDRAGQIAQPFLHPAVELTRPKINKLAADEIRKGIK